MRPPPVFSCLIVLSFCIFGAASPEAYNGAYLVESNNTLIVSNEGHRLQIKAEARELAQIALLNLKQLEEALFYNNETVRWAAQDAIVELGDYAVPVLTKVLRTGERRAKEHACNALQRIGPPAGAAIPVLIESLGSDVSTTNYAARALSTVGQGSTVVRDALREAYARELPSGGAIKASLDVIERSLLDSVEQDTALDVVP